MLALLAREMQRTPGNAAFYPRFDLVPGRGAFQTFINTQDMTALLGGSSGFPPMFGGQRAYTRVCPFPP